VDLFQNPFHILTASPRDNRQRIMELADERSLLLEPSEVKEARSVLSTPRKRLSAEVAWLPGVGERVGELLSLLASLPADLLGVDKLSPIARSNLLAAGLTRLSDYNTEDVAKWILEIAGVFEDVDPKELSIIINEERIVSGFPEVSDLSTIEAEIQERRRHYRNVIKSALDNLPPEKLVKAVTVTVESATNNGKEPGPILIADLVDLYEAESLEFLDEEEGNIRVLVEKLQAALDTKQPDFVLTPTVNQLIQVMRNWDTVAQPIQMSAKSRGLYHDASYRVAVPVHGLAIHMFNKHGKLNFSQQLMVMLQEVFAEVGDVSERTTEDVDALHGIAEQRDRLGDITYEVDIEDIFVDKLRTSPKDITYEANIGDIFVDKLRISPKGIEWKGRRWSLDSITRVRWGGTRHAFGGTYCITFGNASNYTSIKLENEKIYTCFVDCLWKAVGVRLLTEYLKGLRDGKKYRFRSMVVSDYGMELNRICSYERVFCRWSELEIWNDRGVFCIAKKHDRSLSDTLSYQREDNIYVLEAAIRTLLKQGGEKLSSLLRD
jgi:hypothetical protein